MLRSRERSLGKLDPGFIPGTFKPSCDGRRVAYVARRRRHTPAVIMPWETDWDRDILPKLKGMVEGREEFTVIVNGVAGNGYEEIKELTLSADGTRFAYAPAERRRLVRRRRRRGRRALRSRRGIRLQS
jgi:hypothetical protein